MTMKTVTEYVRGLRYKLQMMGISVKGPTYIFGVNKSVLVNSSQPVSVLKKKNNPLLNIMYVKVVQDMNGE